MNNLSWFLYLADTIPNMGKVFGLTGYIILIVWTLFHFFSVKDDIPFGHIILRSNLFLKPLCIGLLLIFLSVFTPSKNTIYLIAGSEAGETVVTSDAGKEILSDIQTIIKQQVKKAVD